VKRLLEREQLVVEVMAQLVDDRAQEALEGHDLTLLRRAHPHGDQRPALAFIRLVQTVQLAVVVRRPRGHDLQADGRHRVAFGERIAHRLRDALHGRTIFRRQRGAQRGHGRSKVHAARQTDRLDRIAGVVDALVGSAEAVVIGEAHTQASRSIIATQQSATAIAPRNKKAAPRAAFAMQRLRLKPS
jgi:hypothetical protein